MKKNRKKSFSLFLTMLLIFILQLPLNSSISNAASKSIGEVLTIGDSYIDNNNIQLDKNKLKEANGFIFNTLVILGIALSVIIGGIIGIKFMISSAEDKAKIKEIMVPYIIGCIIVFSSFTIWKLAVNLFEDI